MGITFQSGQSTTPGLAGGITIQNANVDFQNVTFLNNRANNTTGGGAVNASQNSNVRFFDTVWRSNSATQIGGALEVQEGAVVTIRGNTFIDNRVNGPGHAGNSLGGAIHAGNSTLDISTSRFDSNQAAYAGGAIAIQGVFQGPFNVPRARLSINNSTFVNNQAVRAGSVPPAPTEAGAILIEDQAVGTITHSRFVNNSAETSGAIGMYRSTATIENTQFIFNRATLVGPGTGFGGAIGVLSGDTAADGTSDKPTSTLIVRFSYFEGDASGEQTVAQAAGAILIGGDRSRLEGLSGVPQGGTVASNRANLVVENTVFNLLHVRELGGAIVSDLANATITDSVIMNSSTRSPSTPSGLSAGGGLAIIGNSNAVVRNTVLINNSSGRLGGGVFLRGAHLDMANSSILGNRVEAGTDRFNSQGAAIYSAPDDERAVSATGVVASTLFANNLGTAIYESDRNSGSVINQLRYENNTFFGNSFGPFVFVNDIGNNSVTVSDLNTLVVGGGGRPAVDKSTQNNNAASGTQPIVTALIPGGRTIVGTRAAGEFERGTTAVLGFVAFGTTANLQVPNGVGGNRVLPVSGAGIFRGEHAGLYSLMPANGTQRDVFITGQTALTVFRNGTWFIDMDRDGISERSVAFGVGGDRPFVIDFNGDGLQDLGVFRNGR